MGFTATVVGGFSGTLIHLFGRQWRKAPMFTSERSYSAPHLFLFSRSNPLCRCISQTYSDALAEPWELAIAVCAGGWLANKVLVMEEYYQGVTRNILMDKIARNNGALEQKYVDLLGDSYERVMGEANKAAKSS